MDRKSAPRTRAAAAMEFSSFRNAIGIATCHHERGVAPVDSLEQFVQSQGHKEETRLADELGRDAEGLGGRDVVGRRRRVSVNDQLAGNIHHGEEARYGHENVQQACESGFLVKLMRLLCCKGPSERVYRRNAEGCRNVSPDNEKWFNSGSSGQHC
jgi:hypothetical protein